VIAPIPNVTQKELTAIVQQIANSGKAHVQVASPTSGTITASVWPLEGTVATYSLANGTLTVKANRLEGEIRQQLVADLTQLRAQGI
jgi:hypothetical protein